MTFPEFGKIIEETPKEFPEFGKEISEDEIEEKGPSEKSKKIAKSLSFYGHQPKPETIEKIRRPVGIGLKGLAKGLGGTYGDMLDLAKSIVGEKGKTFIPTSEGIGKIFDKYAKEDFIPNTPVEKIIDKTAHGFGSLMSLGGPLQTALRTGLAAFVPASVSVASEEAGLPDWANASLTIGSAILTHKATTPSLRKINQQLYQIAEKLAEGQVVSAKQLIKNLAPIKKVLAKGGSTGPKAAISKFIEEIEEKAASGNIGVDELMEFKKNIGERMGEFLKIKGSKGIWKLLGKSVDDSIQEFEKVSPQFKYVYRQANSLYKGLNEARWFERWMKKHPVLSVQGTGVLGLLKMAGISGAGAKGIIAAPMLKAAEFSLSMMRNPGLRKAWFGVFKNAFKNEVRATASSLKKFNKELEKEDPELYKDLSKD